MISTPVELVENVRDGVQMGGEEGCEVSIRGGIMRLGWRMMFTAECRGWAEGLCVKVKGILVVTTGVCGLYDRSGWFVWGCYVVFGVW